MRYIFLFILLLPFSGFGQERAIDFESMARKYIRNQAASWGLSTADIAEVKLTEKLTSAHNQMTSCYFNQQKAGVGIHNAITGIHLLPSGKVFFATNRFLPTISDRVNSTMPIIQKEAALRTSFQEFGIPAIDMPPVKRAKGNLTGYYGGQVAHSDILIELTYFPKGNQLLLGWHILFHPKTEDALWSIWVDALTGKILAKENRTLTCAVGNIGHRTHAQCPHDALSTPSAQGPDNASYHVLPYQIESPLHGDRATLTNPAILAASPYGWHDTDGVDGAEYTITKGNNVHAYSDLMEQDTSAGNEPDGGAGLVFDFPFDQSANPNAYQDAATVNLFYMNNMMHDIAYGYGFDEDAGNFQETNYTNTDAAGGDIVLAECQDGEGVNNANFSTMPDGWYGSRMQMFNWVRIGRNLNITQPAAIAGMYQTGSANFGFPVSDQGISGEIILIDDGYPFGSLGCHETTMDLSDKIAFIDRGQCTFAEKVWNAQNAGAKAVIIGSYADNVSNMSGSGFPASAVTIPVVLVKKSDADLIREQLSSGVTGTIIKEESSAPDSLDADFDNGVIAHEYGHGISNRLTGGRDNVFCLHNDEQMGEGWSDFFTLITSAKAGDTGAEPRGIGNYLVSDNQEGIGIRRYPYSTDMSICPITYYDIMNTNRPHPLGEIWTACLWDLYWRMSEVHGFDADIIQGNAGNNMAIQLVMDGMKLQACQPGFIDGRDAILAADVANNGGANECLIWEVFARRGLGYGATQGDTNDRNDGQESYKTPPFCAKELTIQKVVTPVIYSGDLIDVQLIIRNYTGNNVSGIVVTDDIPAPAAYSPGTASSPATVQGNQLVFQIDQMADQDTLLITYQLSTTADYLSTSLWNDGFELDDTKWEKLANIGSPGWQHIDYQSHSGTQSMHVSGEFESSNHLLTMKFPPTLSGDAPILRFAQFYRTHPGLDGGVVELSTDNGVEWIDAEPYFFRNGYTGSIAFTTFFKDKQKAFWGASGDSIAYHESMVDLSEFKDDSILVRFSFASSFEQEEISPGWIIDDVEIMNMKNYDGMACISSDQTNQYCANAPGKGTIVNSDLIISNEALENNQVDVDITPNPFRQAIFLEFNTDEATTNEIQVIHSSGVVVLTKTTPAHQNQIRLSLEHIPSGIYFIRMENHLGTVIKKIVKE